MLKTLLYNIIHEMSLFLSGMLMGVALGIIATLVGVSAYMNKEKDV
jgi:hypothetical protein